MRKIIIKSCFGKEWGDKGYFNIDYKYLNDLCMDLWLIEVFIDKRKKFGLNMDIDTNINVIEKTKKKNFESNNENNYLKEKNNKKMAMMRGSVF